MNYIIGIDEVGRGPLAGPVMVAAFIVPQKLRISRSTRRKFDLPELKDSKELSPEERDIWFKWIKKTSLEFESGKKDSFLDYSISRVYPKQIDKLNIFQAANLAAFKSLQKLLESLVFEKGAVIRIYLDGGLFLVNKDFQREVLEKGLNKKAFKSIETVIKGDEKFVAVKLASIVAKVSRDRYMKCQHKKYPFYGFDVHKGYGTEAHFKAISEHGLCPIHRLTFLKNYRKIDITN